MSTETEAQNMLEPAISKAMETVRADSSITMDKLLKVLRPDAVADESPSADKVPPPAVITADQRKALERLVEVFGQVVPTERRALQPMETVALLHEKAALADIKKMVDKRVEGIRTTVYNHLDVEAESVEGFDREHTPRDKDGHYVLEGEALGTDSTDSKFTREVREGAPSLDLTALRRLAEDDDYPGFTHKDYLAMTTQTRVVDEAKVMIALRKNPEFVKVIADASRPGKVSSAFNVRKA